MEDRDMAKKKILVVDDETALTDMLKMNLEMVGEFEVRTENKATNVITAAREFRPNIILLDVMMPDMDGGEVASQVRGDSGLKDTPILFRTAALTKEEAEIQNHKVGGYPFLAKPVMLEDLVIYINKYAS
ncbi:MAG: response regulator [Candidatus Omnitrophota bacterium]